MQVSRFDHSVLDYQSVCFALGKTVYPALSVSVDRRGQLRLHGLLPTHFGMSVVDLAQLVFRLSRQ